MEQKIKEKTKLFAHANTIIYCLDEELVHQEISQLQGPIQESEYKKRKLFSWGVKDGATVRIQAIKKSGGESLIEASYSGAKISIQVPFLDQASIHNAISCWCVLLHLGTDQHAINKRMMQLQQVSMRLELKRGINHCTIINDSYSADLREFGARSTGELADLQPAPPRDDSWGPGGRKPIEPDTSIGGIVAACRQLKTRKGDRMAVFTLEDAQGGVEVIVFPEAYQRAASLIETGTMILVRGKL